MKDLVIQSREIWTAIALLCGSVMDIKTKRLPAWFMTVFAGGSLAVVAMAGDGDWQQKAIGVLLGGSILLLGKLSGCIGVADGIMVAVMGLLYGGWECAELLMISILFTAVVAIGAIALHKANTKSRLPFVPFLTAGYAVFLLRVLAV